MPIPVWSGVTFSSTGQKLRQIIELYPGDKSKFYFTSSLRNTPNDYHGGRLSYGGSPAAAVDIGFGYPNNTAEVRALAQWLLQFSDLTVELIHASNPSGFYVKNQARVGPYAAADHWNHVHFATSSRLADQILQRIQGGSSGSGSSATDGGLSQSTVSVMPWYQRPTLRNGSVGGSVGHLQFLLRDRLGYSIDKFNPAPFGPQTEAAVKDFQNKYSHLRKDGVVDGPTWAQLEVAAAKKISHGNRPELRRGSEGMWVGYLQHCLRKVGFTIDNVQGFPYGPQTEAAVRGFRGELRKRGYNFGDTDLVNEGTWKALDEVEGTGKYPPAKDGNDGGSSPPPPPPPPPPSSPTYNNTVKPIFGWDASDYDHDRGMRASHITNAAKEGIVFFTHKVTEGTRVVHNRCGEKLRAAKNAGIPFLGAYVVTRTPGNNGMGSVSAQVDFAIAEITRQFPEWKTHPGWFWQVDLEKWSYDAVSVTHGAEMCRLLEQRTGKKAILYAPRWAYGNTIPSPWNRVIWNSHYVSGSGGFKSLYPGSNYAGWNTMSGHRPIILQYTSSATIGGQRTCDANAYEGTALDFAKLIGAGTPSGGSDSSSSGQIPTTPYGSRPALKSGSSGEAVVHLHFLLKNRLGYDVDSGSTVGTKTVAALKNFKANTPPVDGGTYPSGDDEVNAAVWAALEWKAAQVVATGSRPVIGQSVGLNNGPWVGYLQDVLRHKGGYSIDDLPGFPFGPQTHAALANFQEKYNVPDSVFNGKGDGIAGKETWDYIDMLAKGQLPPSGGDPGGVEPPELVKMKDRVMAEASSHGLTNLRFLGIPPGNSKAYGYHNSRARHEAGYSERGKNDYSIQLPLDKQGDALHFSALDLGNGDASIGKPLTITMTQRVLQAINSGDPRVRYLREFYGTTNGNTVIGRTHSSLDGSWSSASSDDSHLWHIHLSFFRAYNNDPEVMKGVGEILLGLPPQSEEPPEDSPGELPESPGDDSPGDDSSGDDESLGEPNESPGDDDSPDDGSPGDEDDSPDDSPGDEPVADEELKQLIRTLIAVLAEILERK